MILTATCMLACVGIAALMSSYSDLFCRDLYSTWHQEHQTSVLATFLTKVVFKVCTCILDLQTSGSIHYHCQLLLDILKEHGMSWINSDNISFRFTVGVVS